MRHQRFHRTLRLVIAILFLFQIKTVNAQVQTMRASTPMGTYVPGFFEYLPVGYSTSTQSYPLLIFIHGMGEIGDGTAASLEPILLHGPPMIIDRGSFPQTFTVDGQTFSFIVLSPQFSHWPTPQDVNQVIDYAEAHYRVDPTRIYLTGLSMGGGICWDYAAENSTYANRVTAIVPTGAASQPNQFRANTIAAGNVGVWAFHNDGDSSVPVTYTIDWVNEINSAPTPPIPPAKNTIFHSLGHDAWTVAYDMTYTENGLNIYQWMLQFQKGRPFIANIPPRAIAGPDQTVNYPNTTTLNGSGSSDPDGSIVSYNWSEIIGPNTATLSSTSIPNPSLSNLIVGNYRFQLLITDNRGAVATSYVDINVTPHTNFFTNGSTHIEAETYSYFNSVMTQPTTDVGGGLNVGGISTGSWMDYFINVPLAGTYTFTARGATPYGAQIQLLNANSAVLGTVSIPNTNGWQTWANATTNISLTAGLQRFRVYCTSGAWNFNWFELSQTTGTPTPVGHPVANAGANQTITLPTNSVTLKGSATDSGATITAYQWSLVSGPSTSITFGSAGAAQTTVNGLVAGTYIFQLKVTDNLNATATSNTQVTVNPAPINKPPVVSAGNDQTITLPTNSVTVTGTASDADGSIASTTWSQLSGPSTAAITSPAQLKTTITGLNQGVYKFQLLAKDNAGATTTASVQVTVNAATVTSKPVANAGTDQTITLPVNSVTLKGSATDSGGTINSYLWTQVSGPSQGAFGTATAASTTVSGLIQGIYKFQLKVGDNMGNSATASVQVTVNAAPQPVTSPGSAIHIEAESFVASNSIMTQPTLDAGGGLNVGGTSAGSWTDYTVSIPSTGSYEFSVRIATPNPGSQIQLRKSDGTVLASLTIPATNGWQDWTTINTNASLTAGTQTLRVYTVSGAWNFNWFELTSGTVSTSHPVANAGSDKTITLPTNSVTLSGSGSDTGGSITSYLWSQISGPSNASITNPNAASTLVSSLVQGTYQFQLKVTDNLGATATSTVNVIVNAAITVSSGATRYIKVQVYGGSNPYVNSEWNNWNVGTASATNINSPNFKFSNGTSSTVHANLSASEAIGDNGQNYGATINGTMAPTEVLRYTSYSNSGRLLTISGLNTSKKYDIELYASRYSGGNTTLFTVNGSSITIETFDNYSNKALFKSITPNAQGQIIIGIDKGANYDYLNGFTITEQGTDYTPLIVKNEQRKSKKEIKDKDGDFSIYPNPISDRFLLLVNCHLKGNLMVELISVNGLARKKFHLIKDVEQPTQFYLNTSDLPKGTYIIELHLKEWKDSKQIIKL
ncbi:MAG: PKD domain-containing protein [Flavisolibacter sp.]